MPIAVVVSILHLYLRKTGGSRFVRRNRMTAGLKKEEFIRLSATRMNADEATATNWLDGVIETPE